MFTRHPRNTSAWRALFNKSGRFLAVLLILCLCITSAKATEDCLVDQTEECCIALCEMGLGSYVCVNHFDCTRILQNEKFFECVARRKCLQWSDPRCEGHKADEVTGPLHCFCREYDIRCSDLVPQA
ncbi:hypothetical protein EDD21DRAFT_365797 [Dissophora ornata]|nr:hypothetical protein EDD21DRAFT_365797 [Dissophora ornata]